MSLEYFEEQSRLSLESYGRPRMMEEPKEIGLDLRHRRAVHFPLIAVVRTHKHKVTTDRAHKFNTAPNLLDRDFAAEQPNQKWVGNISYFLTCERWLYLDVILDRHSRRIIG